MRWLLIVVLWFGCVETNPGYVEGLPGPTVNESSLIPSPEMDHMWICHHPGTVFHGGTCSEQEALYPDGCLVEDDDSKFCWKITKEDCQHIEADWQEKNCYLFNKD